MRVVLYGELPSPGGYPAKLRESAHHSWLADAEWVTNLVRAVTQARGRIQRISG